MYKLKLHPQNAKFENRREVFNYITSGMYRSSKDIEELLMQVDDFLAGNKESCPSFDSDFSFAMTEEEFIQVLADVGDFANRKDRIISTLGAALAGAVGALFITNKSKSNKIKSLNSTITTLTEKK